MVREISSTASVRLAQAAVIAARSDVKDIGTMPSPENDGATLRGRVEIVIGGTGERFGSIVTVGSATGKRPKEAVAGSALGRMVEPAHVADLITFLLGDGAAGRSPARRGPTAATRLADTPSVSSASER